MLQLHPDGEGSEHRLGQNLADGEQVQLVVPARVWQGASLAPGFDFALMGTTMAPGFDPAKYEAGIRQTLIHQYPKFTDRISQLTD